MKIQSTKVFIVFVFSISYCLINRAEAQIDKKHVSQYISTEWQNQLLTLLDSRLSKPEPTPFHFYFKDKIEEHCQDDLDCQWDSYWVILDELNALKLYLQCIPISEKLVELAKARNNLEDEISALWKLGRFYIFLEDFELETNNHLKLLKIYEERGDVNSVLYIKTLIAEDKAFRLKQVEEAVTEMKALIAQAEEINSDRKHLMLTRLFLVYQEFRIIDDLPALLKALEKIPISDPPKRSEHYYVDCILSARALLAWEARDYEQAEAIYQKILALNETRFEGKGDLWYDIDTKLRLARMEWERGNTAKAENILEETYEGAVAFQLHDHIRDNLTMRIELAEATNRYDDALKYTRAFYAHREKVDSISANFDAQRFYTQLANERLQGEKDSQTLELQVMNNQLYSLLLTVVLVLLLATGLFVGYRRQQKVRKALHMQNLLIQQQSEQLRNMDEAKTRFFANISHELRTPLTLMTGPVDTLLKKGNYPAEETKLLKMVERNGQQLQKLINKILDLQKMESGKMVIKSDPTHLYPFFRSHLGQFESLADSLEIDYSPHVSIAKKAVAEIDQQKCQEILNNLLSNAFKFTPKGGSIRASVALKGQELHMSVSDTGPGIHPDDMPYVFDHYFQTNRPEKPIEGGTGIGLALCEEYMKLFDGHISVKNNPDKGASFSLSFPLTLSAQPVAKVSTVVHSKGTSLKTASSDPTQLSTTIQENDPTKPSLLIVEDNAELRDYLSLILQDQYQLIAVADGQEALDYLLPDPEGRSVAPCQLILSDLMMPRMDGYQMVERLKSSDATRHIPVVMLTARADVRDKLKALRIGVDDYLLKPFNEEELKVRIANLLQNQAVRLSASSPEQTATAPPCLLSASEQEWLAAFEAYVQQNIKSDILSVTTLASAFAMSESSLYRQLKRLIGLSPGQYLKEVRLDNARQLLENRVYDSVEQVASAIGYSDFRAFSRSFKQRYGKLPSKA